MTPKERKDAGERLDLFFNSVGENVSRVELARYLKDALKQIDDDEGLMRAATERVHDLLTWSAMTEELPSGVIEESERVLRALRARLGEVASAPVPEADPPAPEDKT